MNFGRFHFRQADRTLWRDSERVHMTAKARDLLACLVAANGRFVSKAEIMTAVWPDIHVLPDNIKVLVHEIRSVLEEDARNPHFIRSEAGLGYAFVPEGLTPNPPAAGERTHGLFLNRNRELAVLAESFSRLTSALRSTCAILTPSAAPAAALPSPPGADDVMNYRLHRCTTFTIEHRTPRHLLERRTPLAGEDRIVDIAGRRRVEQPRIPSEQR